MRIAQILPALESGGAELVVLELASALSRAGIHCVVISAGGRLVARLKPEGVQHYELPVGEKTPTGPAELAPELARILLDERIDVIDLHSRMPAWVALEALRSMPAALRPRVVTTCHGLYPPGTYSSVMLAGDRVIVVSQFLKRYLETSFASARSLRLDVIPRGVDLAHFRRGYRADAEWVTAFYARYPALRGKKLITLAARLTPWKGQIDLLDAAALLNARRADLAFLLVGEAHPSQSSYAAQLLKLAAGLRLGNVVFAGHRDDIREILSLTAVAVSPSRDPEPFGKSVLEALSLGIPVAAYGHGGAAEVLREILPEGLITPLSISGLAEKIEQLVDRPPAVASCANFELGKMTTATIRLYQELAQAEKDAGRFAPSTLVWSDAR